MDPYQYALPIRDGPVKNIYYLTPEEIDRKANKPRKYIKATLTEKGSRRGKTQKGKAQKGKTQKEKTQKHFWSQPERLRKKRLRKKRLRKERLRKRIAEKIKTQNVVARSESSNSKIITVEQW
jgi:hypothetical protein